MEDHHVDVVKKENNNISSVFTLFSDLTGEKNENPKHCLTLVKSLRGNEFSVGSGSNLEYSVKRLVRGLGSTRLHSQCGCFAALTCVLKYQACLVETVLETLEKEQKPAQGATKSEVRALHTGCVLTCGAIIHSGLFSSQSKEVQEDILKKLIEAGKKKSYLIPVICRFLADVIKVVDDEQFKNVVWPICKFEFFQNLEACGPDAFYLLLVCLKTNQKITNKFLQKNSITTDLLLNHIAKCLFNFSVKWDHPIYDNLGHFFCTNANASLKFWVKCIDENAKVNPYKDTVLISLFSCITKNLKEATVIPKLLVPKFLETVIKALSLKQMKKPRDDCSNIAKLAVNSMVQKLCAEGTSNEVRFQTIKKLLFYPGNLKFEMKTGTKCINSLVSHLSCDFTKQLVDIYRQVVSDNIKKVIDEDGTEENWNSKEKQHALHIFTKMLNHPSVKNDIYWKLDEIKFIFEIAFVKKFQLPSEVEKCAKDCFYKAIMVQMPSLKELILFLDELAMYVNENVKNKKLKASEEVEGLWDKMHSVVEILKRKSSNKLFTAVHVLLIYMGLHLFVDFELAKGGIEELLSCYEHLKETQKKKKSQDNSSPHWTEVTVDLILSLLSRENRLWRHVVSCVFPQVVSQMTPTALQQIIDALDPKSQNDILRHVNSDDSESESEGSSETSASEAEESDLEEAEDEGKPNDQLRLAVRNALGYSAAQTDDESIDMDQMNEEEERQLNESLSEAFKQFKSKTQTKKKKQTKEEEALTHFRVRVLDLLEIYITNSPAMGGCLDLLLPLFDLLELSIKDHYQRPLQTRVDTVIKHLSAVKSFSNTDDVNQTVIKDVFRSVIGRKETSALVFVEMSQRISDCTAFLVRCSQLLPVEDSDIPLVDEYDSLLKAFFQSRDFKLPISTFQAVLRMSWKGNVKIVETLFQLLVSSSIRIFKKMKIIELLRLFYKNDKFHESCQKTTKSELNEIETNFIKTFMSFLSDHEKTESKSTEKMYLSFFSNVILLINVIQQSWKKHREETKKMPPWKKLVQKMIQMEVIMSNKKTRSQLGNLANVFEVQLPANEKLKRKRTLSETSKGEEAEERGEGEVEEEGEEEKQRKKKKKKLSAEKRKLKEESRKLREEISSNGLTMVRFSEFDSGTLPEPEIGEAEEGVESEEGLKNQKKKRRKETVSNGHVSGYSNEVGEAFRSLIPKSLVHATYALAFGYIFADTGDKTLKIHEKEKRRVTYRTFHVATTAADTFIWQTLASIAIPGFTINRLCALTFYTASKFTKLSLNTRKWMTTAVGLGCIPFIVKPIDKLVDQIMDKMFRPFYNED